MPPTQPKPTAAPAVASLKHTDKRRNIPTEELRDFVADDERAPKTLRYPRDPALDPQLVWKGKEEQDAADLTVPAVPIYIQEKIHPRALIEDLRAQSRGAAPQQMQLFADFNDLDFTDLVDFYHHEQSWTNRMILGDSLYVMASLAEKEGLKGQVQMIYIDPPYGIKFGSNWQVSTRKREITDGKIEDLTRQPEQIRAFRDTWELGIHSYLAYLRDRMVVARELLTESGSIFVQIGDENAHLVRCVMDEVFGSENFAAQITYAKTTGATVVMLPGTADYILWYCKNKDEASHKFRRLYMLKAIGGEGAAKYDQVLVADDIRRPITNEERLDPSRLSQGAQVYRLDNLMSQSMGREKGEGAASWFPVGLEGREFLPNIQNRWKTNEAGMERLLAADRIQVTGNTVAYVRFLQDFPAFPISNVWSDIGGIQSRTDPKIYVVQTATETVKRCMLMTTDPGDLVLDPTCGSGTTAYVAEQWGRRWITCDTSRVALALARTRLMSAKFLYFLLADSTEGTQKEAELSGRYPMAEKTAGEIKKGFVYNRIPHIMLNSITRNEEIDTITAKWQPQLDAIRADLNTLLGQAWEAWQVPAEAGAAWPAEARRLHTEWLRLRRARQQEIDASIARHADTELLYDQPYDDPKRVRVSGPFTVESLSPYRMLTADGDRPATERAGQAAAGTQYETAILANLLAAGVQNTKKGERLKFDRVEPYPGLYLQALGDYTDAEGHARRAAIALGPEHGTVSPDQVREAAKEAVKGVDYSRLGDTADYSAPANFDLLIVCGFAFDPHVGDEVHPYGRLPVLPVRMNPDLLMGADLLKKTGAGNLFMVFGEPDIAITPQPDGRLVVTIRGLDIYDPTSGEIRASSVDDLACWFLDTAYDGESFFVRHAYFTGAGDPYGKLQRALRAEIDAAAWASLYATTSRPFARPIGGRIAVKVINHYGDEVLKVYAV